MQATKGFHSKETLSQLDAVLRRCFPPGHQYTQSSQTALIPQRAEGQFALPSCSIPALTSDLFALLLPAATPPQLLWQLPLIIIVRKLEFCLNFTSKQFGIFSCPCPVTSDSQSLLSLQHTVNAFRSKTPELYAHQDLYAFHFLLPIKNKFHILFSKYYHCFVTKDTRVITTKLPESQTHNNVKINHKNIQIKILMQNK